MLKKLLMYYWKCSISAILKDSPPQNLSQGEKKCISLIRALVNDAPLTIADEPTGNLTNEQRVAKI